MFHNFQMRFDSIQDLSFLDKKSNTSPGESKSRKRAFSLVGCDLATIAREITYMWGLGASETACTNVSIIPQLCTLAFVVVFSLQFLYVAAKLVQNLRLNSR